MGISERAPDTMPAGRSMGLKRVARGDEVVMRNRIWVGIGVVLGALLLAGSATAASTATQEFVEVLGVDDLGIVTASQPLEYQHTFAPDSLPAGTLVDVEHVKLAILLSECTDWVSCRYDLRSDGEWAVIEVDGTQIYDNSVRYFSLVLQDVTLLADINAVGDTIDISISSTGSESFAAIFSVAEIAYSELSPTPSGGDTVPMPEPSAAVVFGMGMLVLSRRLRT